MSSRGREVQVHTYPELGSWMQIPTKAVTPAGTSWLRFLHQNPLGRRANVPRGLEAAGRELCLLGSQRPPELSWAVTIAQPFRSGQQLCTHRDQRGGRSRTAVPGPSLGVRPRDRSFWFGEPCPLQEPCRDACPVAPGRSTGVPDTPVGTHRQSIIRDVVGGLSRTAGSSRNVWWRGQEPTSPTPAVVQGARTRGGRQGRRAPQGPHIVLQGIKATRDFGVHPEIGFPWDRSLMRTVQGCRMETESWSRTRGQGATRPRGRLPSPGPTPLPVRSHALRVAWGSACSVVCPLKGSTRRRKGLTLGAQGPGPLPGCVRKALRPHRLKKQQQLQEEAGVPRGVALFLPLVSLHPGRSSLSTAGSLGRGLALRPGAEGLVRNALGARVEGARRAHGQDGAGPLPSEMGHLPLPKGDCAGRQAGSWH